MKNLITYLKALWSWVSGSQRKKIGVTLGEGAIEHPFSTYSAPFGICWQPSGKLHSVVRCAAVLVMLFTIGSGNAWGTAVDITAGTNGSSATISSNSGVKVGTSSKGGTMTITVPSGTTSLTFYAAAWNGVTGLSLNITATNGTVSPTSVSLTADEGISGSTPFTLNGSASTYRHTITLSNVTASSTLTFTTSIKKRFVAWGADYSTGSSCTEISPTLTYSTDSIGIGGTATVSALNKDGSTGGVTYTISPASGVASIDSETGEVTGTGTGTVTVTASIAAAGGKCAGSATATIKVRRAINYYIGSTSYTKGGVDGATLLSVLPTSPSSCDDENYPHFYGWKAGSISGVATSAPSILSTETVSSSSAANTYYAVFTDALDYSTTHTSNVNISSNATAVIGGSNYDAKKLGSSGSGGSFTITVPSGTTKLYLHAAGWNNKSSSLTLSTSVGSISPNTAQNLTSNSGVANSTPFTLATPITNAFFEYTLSNINSAATITITANNERALVWGVNSATSAGGSGNYITTCCTPLGTINGSITLSQSGTSVTVKGWTYTQGSGAAESNISTYDVYLYSDADSYADPIQTQTCAYNAKATGVTFASLSYGTTYKIKIGATGNTNYCDITPIQVTTINSTSTQTFQLACDVPTNVAASSITASSATVSWDDVATNYQYVLDQSSSDPAGAGTAVNGAHSVDLSTLSESTTYYFHVRTNCGNSVFSNWATISFNTPAAACSSYSFHDGTDGSNPSDWQINCFTYSGNSDRQWLKNFTIRNKSHYYVGYQGSFYNDNLGNKNAKSYTNQMQYMQLALDREHNSNNQLGSNYAGVQGTLLCYDNSSSDNLYVDFLPDGYYFILDAAGTPTALAMTCTDPDMTAANILSHNTVWETDIQTITYVNKKYTVGIKADATIAGKVWQTTRYNTNEDMTSLKKRNSSGGFTGTLAAADVTAGTRGKYRIWANNFSTTSGEKNWYAHFVPYYRITYNGSGADGSTTASTDVSCEGNDAARTVVAAANGFTVPTGKTFGGWASSPENAAAGTVAYAAGADVVLTQSIVLYAIWTDIDYTVTVNQSPSVGATTTGQTTTAHYNGTINISTTVPDGYRFNGWTASPSVTFDDASATSTSFTMPANDVTITANFQQVDTYIDNIWGTVTAAQTGTYTRPTIADQDDADMTDCQHLHYHFIGWITKAKFDVGTAISDGDIQATGSVTANGTTYYAVWAKAGAGGGWTKVTNTSDLEAGYTYALIRVGDTYYIPNALATSGGPSCTAVTKTGDNINFVDAMKFNATYDDTDDGYIFESVSNPGNYLWGSNTNNGIRINSTNSSSGATKVWYAEDYDYYNSTETGYGIVLYCNAYTTENNYRYLCSYGTQDWRCYTSCGGDNQPANMYKYAISYTDYKAECVACSNEVTVAYDADPTGGTVSVTYGGTPIAENGTVETCSGVTLTVTLTPAEHYSVTNFAATGVAGVTTSHVDNVYTVTIPADATGTLTLTPTFTEDAHVAINWNVNGVNQSIAATEGLTWVYSGGDLTALPSVPSVPAGCSGTKVFAGWSQNHSDATEEDASYYDDLFTAVGDAPTGISSEKTFYAVFATSSANPLAGTVIWDEPWTGTSDKTTPSSPSSGATVYNSTSLTYAYTNGNTTTQVYADGTMYSGGAAAPELLISKTSPSGVWTVTNIPTGGSAQTELTLSYKTNKTTIAVTSGTSGITIGDATVDGNTYTHTITISHSPSTINNFSLIFTNTGSANARLDDIHLVVPGSGTMTDYVTLCAPSYTITYNKNTEDAVTNLPSPTSVLQSTGSGTLSSTVPERATYTFSGWSETTSGAVAYAAGGSITGVTGDKTLYAVWTKTPVEELTLNYSELNKYVGDPAVTLEVTGVTPEGADATVTWSSNNSSVASVVAATGVVTFGTVGTATITATSSVTGTTTAYCYVTVRNKPTASFTDLIHDGNGTDLSTYHMQNVAGTEIVFPTLDDYATPGDDCDSKHYIFVGWTTSDNNDDPEDHLVASGELEDDQDKVFYAVWADGVEGVSYTKLTTNSFKTSPTKYVIGAEYNGDTYYFYSCAATDENNGNGGCTNAPGTNAPIQFTLSGTADALVATSSEASARYLTPLTAKNFQMSSTSTTIQLNDDGTIANPSNDSWTLRFNTSEDYLRWYNSATGNAAYFYEVTAGAAVSYRTSCCTNNVPAPTVVATNTAYTVTLTWAAVDGATGYEVSWNGGAFTAATSPCVKSDLTASTDYTYKVRATYDPLVKCGALVASGNVTTDDVYTVTYSGGTGTGSCSPSGSVAPASYEAGATVTLAPTNSYSMTSNTFAAWVVKDADDNDVPVSNNQFTMPAKNVTVTATWTAVQDKYYDRMHDGTDGSHGGVQDGEGKYYLVREGCNYTVPTLTDDDDGDTDCHTTHYKLLGWIAYSHLKTDGSGQIKPGEESYIFQGGGTKSATGATYYAIWAIMTE